MFTPGSKYFLGLTGVSLVSAVLYTFLINPSDLGAYALFGLFLNAAVVAGFSLFTRDGEADSVAEAIEANAEAPSSSFWPIVFALGGAITLLGLATNQIVFVVGLGALIGGGLEWTMQNWSERASADNEFNKLVRHRAVGALDYPGLAAVGLGVIAFLFSRIMLTVSKEQAPIIFIVAATAVLIVGSLIATKPALRGKSAVIVMVAGAVVLAVTGIIGGINGERHELAVVAEEQPYSVAHRECGAEASTHYDHKANNTVSLRSSVLATITVKDGKLAAQMVGLPKDVDTITIPRSNATNVLFRNLDEKEYRLLANLGEVKVGTTDVMEKVGTCTQLTGKNQEQVMTITVPKPSFANGPYTFTVPGLTGEIKLVVP